jgi:hypothetical protein
MAAVCRCTNYQDKIRLFDLPLRPAPPVLGRRRLILVYGGVNPVSPQAIGQFEHAIFVFR